MTNDQYIGMFYALGFQNIGQGRLLRHPNGMPPPSLYFNYLKRRVSFAGYASQAQHYPSRLWDRLRPQQKKDNEPHLITVVPKSGKEWEAFCELLAGAKI